MTRVERFWDVLLPMVLFVNFTARYLTTDDRAYLVLMFMVLLWLRLIELDRQIRALGGKR